MMDSIAANLMNVLRENDYAYTQAVGDFLEKNMAHAGAALKHISNSTQWVPVLRNFVTRIINQLPEGNSITKKNELDQPDVIMEMKVNIVRGLCSQQNNRETINNIVDVVSMYKSFEEIPNFDAFIGAQGSEDQSSAEQQTSKNKRRRRGTSPSL